MPAYGPLLDEFRRLQEDGESGILVLSRDAERLSISYFEGMILSVSLNRDTHRLGTYLVREGLLTEKNVLKIVAEARKREVLFGEAAVGRQHVDPREIAEIVRRQAFDLLTYAFEHGFRRESFTKNVRPLYAAANIDVPQILLEMSRRNPAPLDCSSTTVLALKDDEDLSGMPWFPKELCVLGELNTPTTIANLLQSTGLDEPTLRRILAVLDRLGIIEEVGDRGDDGAESPAVIVESGLVKKSVFPFESLVPKVSNPVLGEELEILKNPLSFISEQFKTLKVRIREDFSNPPRVLTFSSPEQQDGKSLVSANFALTLSLEPGRRTVIVDCDLRSPALDRYLGVSPEPGLIQRLSNPRLSPYCYMRRLGNLYFMTSGGISDTPTELLSLRRMQELVETLKKDFDTVILDAPPLAPIADARIVAGLSDGVIMVIRAGKTSNRSIENAFKNVDKKRLLGVVLNDVEQTSLNGYLNRYYYGYGGYNSKYSQKPKIRTIPKGYLDS